MSRPFRSHGAVARAQAEALRAGFGEFGSLARVMVALDERGLEIDEVIPMDEYTIDLLVELPDDLTLVFDTT